MMLTNHKSLIITTYTKPASINLFSIGKRHFFSIRFPKTIKSIEETIAPNNDNIRFQLFKNLLEGRNRIVKLFIGLFHTRSLKIELNEIIECYLIPYIFSIIN